MEDLSSPPGDLDRYRVTGSMDGRMNRKALANLSVFCWLSLFVGILLTWMNEQQLRSVPELTGDWYYPTHAFEIMRRDDVLTIRADGTFSKTQHFGVGVNDDFQGRYELLEDGAIKFVFLEWKGGYATETIHAPEGDTLGYVICKLARKSDDELTVEVLSDHWAGENYLPMSIYTVGKRSYRPEFPAHYTTKSFDVQQREAFEHFEAAISSSEEETR